MCPEMASGEGADTWPQQHPLTRGVACSVSEGDIPHRLCALRQPCPAPPARLLLVNGSVSTVSHATKCRVNRRHTRDPLEELASPPNVRLRAGPAAGWDSVGEFGCGCVWVME